MEQDIAPTAHSPTPAPPPPMNPLAPSPVKAPGASPPARCELFSSGETGQLSAGMAKNWAQVEGLFAKSLRVCFRAGERAGQREPCAHCGRSPCAHCSLLFIERDLAEHEGSCPEAQIECPNAGCGLTVARGGVSQHREACRQEEVQCPCPGCEESMPRAEVGGHLEASGVPHLQSAWREAAELEFVVAFQKAMNEELHEMVEEKDDMIDQILNDVMGTLDASGPEHLQRASMEEKLVELRVKVADQDGIISVQGETIARQNSVIAGLRFPQELTRVFTWSTDSEWSDQQSLPYTFADGVRGLCGNFKRLNDVANGRHFIPETAAHRHCMAFELQEGPQCQMHFKFLILDKDDKVLRGVEATTGWEFTLTAADKAGAVRADGSIKLRTVVHLYLPE